MDSALPPLPEWRCSTRGALTGWLLVLSMALPAAAAELQPKTLAAWETYILLTEQRIETELDDSTKFLALDFLADADGAAIRGRLRKGGLEIRRMRTRAAGDRQIAVNDGMIHHWVGVAYIPGVNLAEVTEWVQEYDHHAGRFPEVIASKLISRRGDTYEIYFKLRRKKVITVYYNTYYSASYHPKGPRRLFSRSHSTKIAQLEDAETPQEREKPVGNDSGFLWRLNSYWRYEEADGGVYVECESVSLSRDIPFGFGWILGSYVESVPRESLENTLGSIRDGVLKSKAMPVD